MNAIPKLLGMKKHIRIDKLLKSTNENPAPRIAPIQARSVPLH